MNPRVARQLPGAPFKRKGRNCTIFLWYLPYKIYIVTIDDLHADGIWLPSSITVARLPGVTGEPVRMHRVVGIEKEPLTRSQSLRSRAMIVVMILVFGWDIVSKLFGLNTSHAAGHLSCDLQFLYWPASLLSPQRYSMFISEHCASGDMTGVVPVAVLLAKYSLAILFTFTMWASLWPDRHLPRAVISRAERKALQNSVAKPLTEGGFVARRVLMGSLIIGMNVSVYVILFTSPPEQTPTGFLMLIFASSSSILIPMTFAGASVWLALLIKR